MKGQQSIFLRENEPEIITQLIKMGYKPSEYCNDGKFINTKNGIYYLVNHEPFENFMNCNSNVELFLENAKLKLQKP